MEILKAKVISGRNYTEELIAELDTKLIPKLLSIMRRITQISLLLQSSRPIQDKPQHSARDNLVKGARKELAKIGMKTGEIQAEMAGILA